MKRVAMFLVIVITAAVAAAQEVPPKATEGYEWVRLEPLRAMFMKPAGWHYKSELRAGNQTFLLTREDLATQKLLVGLTVTFVRARGPAAQQASTMIDKYMESHELKKAWTETVGAMSGYGARVRRNRPPSMVHVVSLANERTNSVYLITFEAPEAEWDKAWALGEPILKSFMLDEED